MFVSSLAVLRNEIPILPDELMDVDAVAARLSDMAGVAAMQDGELVGYLASWSPIEGFRGTRRRAAYVPEWAHGAAREARGRIYRALYRAASTAWVADGCDVHAITVLAGETATMDTWFWNGFGLAVVDGVRATTPLGAPPPEGFSVRMATLQDAPTLATLDTEHNRHYEEPPVFMAPRTAYDVDAWSSFLERPGNSAWLAQDETGPFGFLRFDREFDGADVIGSKGGVFIDGAYVRPAHRGRGAATAILDAASHHYAEEGLTYSAVDFETFNPEAAAFWMRHFTPVCYSLMRVPEVSDG
jgi:GNAT superfamily N-acetyltransferase